MNSLIVFTLKCAENGSFFKKNSNSAITFLAINLSVLFFKFREDLVVELAHPFLF